MFIFETPTNYYQNNDSLKSIARYFSTSQKEKEMLDFIPPRKNKLKRNSTFLQKQPKAGRWHPEVKQAKLPQNTCGAYIQINHSVLKKKEGFLVPLLFSGMFEHFLAFPLRFLTLSPFSFGKISFFQTCTIMISQTYNNNPHYIQRCMRSIHIQIFVHTTF